MDDPTYGHSANGRGANGASPGAGPDPIGSERARAALALSLASVRPTGEDPHLIDHALGFASRVEAERIESAMARDPAVREEVETWREVHALLAERFEAEPPGMDRLAAIPLPKARPARAGGALRRLPIRMIEAFADARLAVEARLGAAARPLALAAALAIGVLGVNAVWRNSRDATPGSIAATPSPSMTVTREIRTVIAEGSSVQMLAPERMRLDAGAVWLWVKPGGRGFVVETPFSEVRVVGTSFGVTVSPKGLVVDVVEGRVAIGPRDGPDTSIGAGFRLGITADGAREFADRPEGTELPYWVDALVAAERDEGFATYLPSIGVHRGP